MTMHRRDFVGSGLLAGLFLSVPAWAGQKADQRAREPRKVTGRVDLEAKDDDGLCLNVYLTNHGKTAEELQSDGGHAMLREDSITLDGQEAFLFPMAPMTRMGPRPEWIAIAPQKEVRVGSYTIYIADTTAKVSPSSKLGGSIILTLRSGDLSLDLATSNKQA